MFNHVIKSIWGYAEVGIDEASQTATPAASSSIGPKDVLDSIVAYGVDTAFKYGLDTSFGAVQTVCAVVGVVGGATAMNMARGTFFPQRIPVVHLYNRLRLEGGPLAWPHLRISFGVSPYSALAPDAAVILQGRPQEGKTTLLRTSIPWYRRWNVWPISNLLLLRGIYFNGAQAASTTFERWLIQQMFGSVPQGGSELHGALMEYRNRQWFRIAMEKMRVPILNPRPVIIIVDQFEQLMIRHPSQALHWADTITQYHVRDNLARVIFVVNSDAGTSSLRWYSYFGQRYNIVKMDPRSGSELSKLSMIDRKLFERCKNNVGMYKAVQKMVEEGQCTDDSIDFHVKVKLLLWNAMFCLKFPTCIHPDWIRTLGTAGLEGLKIELIRLLSLRLHVPARTPEQNYRVSRRILDAVTNILMLTDTTNFLGTSQQEWEKILRNEGVHSPILSRIESKMVAYHIKKILSNPKPDVPSKKPLWRC